VILRWVVALLLTAGFLWTSFLLSRGAIQRLSDWIRFYASKRDWPALLLTPVFVIGELILFVLGASFWPITLCVLSTLHRDRKDADREAERASYLELLDNIRADRLSPRSEHGLEPRSWRFSREVSDERVRIP